MRQITSKHTRADSYDEAKDLAYSSALLSISLYIAPSMLIDNSNTVNGEIKHIERLESFDVCQESAWPDAKVKPTTTK